MGTKSSQNNTDKTQNGSSAYNLFAHEYCFFKGTHIENAVSKILNKILRFIFFSTLVVSNYEKLLDGNNSRDRSRKIFVKSDQSCSRTWCRASVASCSSRSICRSGTAKGQQSTQGENGAVFFGSGRSSSKIGAAIRR